MQKGLRYVMDMNSTFLAINSPYKANIHGRCLHWCLLLSISVQSLANVLTGPLTHVGRTLSCWLSRAVWNWHSGWMDPSPKSQDRRSCALVTNFFLPIDQHDGSRKTWLMYWYGKDDQEWWLRRDLRSFQKPQPKARRERKTLGKSPTKTREQM